MKFCISYLFMIINKWLGNSATWLTSGSATIILVSSENRRDVNTELILNGRSLIYKRKTSTPRTQPSCSPCWNLPVRITTGWKWMFFCQNVKSLFLVHIRQGTHIFPMHCLQNPHLLTNHKSLISLTKTVIMEHAHSIEIYTLHCAFLSSHMSYSSDHLYDNTHTSPRKSKHSSHRYQHTPTNTRNVMWFDISDSTLLQHSNHLIHCQIRQQPAHVM